MKKKLTITALLLSLALTLFAIAACGGNDPEHIVLKPSESEMTITQTTTLQDYMDYLVDKGELEYEISGTFITSINGVANTTNSYWLLYTDDSANSDKSWGTLEYGGKTYNSATLGAADLIVASGCTYIWSFESF